MGYSEQKISSHDDKAIAQLHQTAMNLYEKYLLGIQDHVQDPKELNKFLLQAVENETRAANILIRDLDRQPTRSILFGSAAEMAIEAGLFSEAVELAREGLRGKSVPRTIQLQLNAVLTGQ